MNVSIKDSIVLIAKMIDYHSEIEQFIKGMGLMDFHRDIKTVRAVTNNILQIGELSKKISGTLKKKYNSVIDWENLRETRNLIAHESENISHKRLWDTATYDLRKLNSVLIPLYKQLDSAFNKRVSTKPKEPIKNSVAKPTTPLVSQSTGTVLISRPVINKPTVNKSTISIAKYEEEYEDYDYSYGGSKSGRSRGRSVNRNNAWD